MKDNKKKIWKGKASLNILIWSIVVFGMLLIFEKKYNFSPLFMLLGIPIWILISFVVDYNMGLTNYDN